MDKYDKSYENGKTREEQRQYVSILQQEKLRLIEAIEEVLEFRISSDFVDNVNNLALLHAKLRKVRNV